MHVAALAAVDRLMDKTSQGMGFWRCWAMSTGVMIGSGVFLLPAVLAPFGGIGFVGWLVTSVGVILLSLSLSRLARRTRKSGGPYAYAHEAFGDLTGFLIAWGYWLSLVFAITAISVAFAAYFGSLVPAIGTDPYRQTAVAAVAIWVLTAINIRGVMHAATAQLALTVLKVVPLLIVIAAGVAAGSVSNLPPFNPSDTSVAGGIASCALLTMWAFIGVEAAVVPSGDVRSPTVTIPRAVVAAAVSVAVLYIALSFSVNLLVPMDVLAGSTAPLVDAAAVFGSWGAVFVGAAALVSTAGSLNGNILLSGQIPSSVAQDQLAPSALSKRNKGHSPYVAILISAALATSMLFLNVSDDLVGTFTFLISISTLAVLAPYGVSALAELMYSWRSARAWAIIALLTIAYVIVAIAGSGAQDDAGIGTLAWGTVLFAAGVPVHFLFRRIVSDAHPD